MTTNRQVLDYLTSTDTTINPDVRYYFVGKLIKQDLAGAEPGYRETLFCRLCTKPMLVTGPNHFGFHNRYMAKCINDKCFGARFRYYGRNVEELWKAVQPQQEV